MTRARFRHTAVAVTASIAGVACVRAPSPLTPNKDGSVGLPHRGSLSHGAALPRSGPGFLRLREDARAYGTLTLVRAIEHASAVVRAAYPGSVLVIGDLSLSHGGQLLPHLSHRTGRDADLLLYVTTLGGARVTSPGFVAFGADGLGWDAQSKRFLRFDVAREWLLIKTLVEDDDARVQWIFLNHVLSPLVIEWALAKGEPLETIRRAEQVLLEPRPGGAHNDHTHVRVACGESEIESGCERNGPDRAWFSARTTLGGADAFDHFGRRLSTDDLVREVAEPLADLVGPRGRRALARAYGPPNLP